MGFREHWRASADWRDEGLPISSSTSDEAVKLYDAALTQLVGWYDDPSEQLGGGLGGTLEKLSQADPEFVLGKTLSLGIELLGTGTSIRLDPSLSAQLDELKVLANARKSSIEWREWAHVEALDRFAHSNMSGAAKIWEEILVKHPTDMHALKFAHDIYFYLGERSSMCSSIARVYDVWQSKPDRPLGEYIHGMYAFGLEETQNYAEAEKQARMGLERQPCDAWATHAMAHVLEMGSRSLEGLGFLSSTIQDWNRCNFLACHNIWHWALFHIERDEPDAAMVLLENEILTRATASGAMLDIVDASSLLYRLELLHSGEGYTRPEMWQNMATFVEPHFKDQILGFNQAHFAMLCLGAGREKDAENLLDDLRSATPQIVDHWPDVTSTILEAMIDFKREKFSDSVSKMLAIRDQIPKIGGSDAQRDLFNQLLVMGAIRAGDTQLCAQLIRERHALKGDDIVVRKLKKFIE